VNKVSDKQFLIWLYERLYYVHKEPQQVDYMLKLGSIIDAMDKNIITPNIGGYKVKGED
jgi:hypothetical protein